MTKQIYNSDRGDERSAHHVRLPGFVVDDDIGLGDVNKRTTSYLGIRLCGGCEQRRAALNRCLVFTRRRT
jgi:hypothetical protein